MENTTEVVFSNTSTDKLSSYENQSSILSGLFDTIPTTAEKSVEVIQQPVWIISCTFFILGTFANGLTIRAIMSIPHNVQSPYNEQSPHLKLIISLACSDISILLATFCGDLIYLFATMHDDCIIMLKTLVLHASLLATLLNLTAMAVNHYLATFNALTHPVLMTNRRVNYIICGIWIVSATVALMELVTGTLLADTTLENHTIDSFCAAAVYDSFKIQMLIISIIFVVLIIIIIIYVKIYYQVKMSRPDRTPNLKTLVTVMLFIGTFVLFWTPQGVYYVYMHVFLITDRKHYQEQIREMIFVNNILFLILQLNSLADPIIYAIRLPKVQRGYYNLCCNNTKCCKDLKQSLGLQHAKYEHSVSSQERVNLSELNHSHTDSNNEALISVVIRNTEQSNF